MIRVVLPAHLRALARINGEVHLDIVGRSPSGLCSTSLRPATRLCAGPSARTAAARGVAFIRFFACELDLSHEPPDTPLPEPVAGGTEPYLIIGAMAGG